jgi:hypothetical protein
MAGPDLGDLDDFGDLVDLNGGGVLRALMAAA